MSGGRLNFKATIDDKDFNRKLDSMKKGVDALSKSVTSANRSLGKGNTFNITDKSITNINNSTNTLNRTLNRTTTNLTQVNQNFNQTNNTLNQLNNTTNNLNKNLNQTSDASNRASGGLKGVFTRLVSYFGVFVTIRTAINLLRSFYDTTKQLDTINKSMNATAVNAEHLAANMEFLNRVTEDSGLKFTETAIAFNKFYAASKDKMSLNEIHMIFDKISKAAALMGMSVHDQNLIFLALEQMMSKGKVSSEELRRQLGERLPGAFDIMAKAVGVSTSELDEMMRKGEIISSEVLPKFALEVEKAFGAENIQKVENMAAAENRLSNAWIHLVDNMNSGEGTLAKVFMGFMDIATGILNVVTVSKQLSEEIGKEQVELNMLIGRIVALNEDNKKREILINQLKNTYPDFIGFIKDEDFSNKNLLETLNLVNDNYRDRILLQTQVEKTSEAIRKRDSLVQKQSESLLHAYRQLVNINTKYDLGLIITPSNIQEVISEMNNLRGSVSGLEKDLLKVRQPLTRSMEQFEKDIEIANNEVQAQEAFQEELRKSLGVITETERANIKQMEDYNQKLEERVKLAKELGGVEGKDFNEFDLKGVNDYIKKIEKLNAEQTEADKKGEALAKKRMDFIFSLQKAENDLTQSTLSGLDLELAKVEEVYQSRLKKAKELGANQKALNDIESLRVREIETVTYKADTEALKISLEQQKKDYEDFENYKKQVGVEKATEMYSGIIDVSKSYYDVLRDELNNIDLSTATAKEKERYNALFKMFQEYSINKQEEERKNLETLISMTQSYEQKILNLREEYEKKKSDLSKDYTGDDLDNRLDILDKEFRDKLSGIIDDFNKENNLGDISSTLIAATKSQIMAQIKSLEGYLNTATNLTESQVNKIRGIISELNNNLFTATGNEDITSLDAYYNEIERIKEALIILESQKKNALDLGGEDAAEKVALLNAQIDALNKRLEDLNNSKIIAIGSEFGRISSFLSEMSNKFNGVNSGVQKMLNSMAKATAFASEMNDYFKDISTHSNAIKDGTDNIGTAFSGGMGYLGMFMSLVSILGKFSTSYDQQRQKEIDRAEERANILSNQLQYERSIKEAEIDRARREKLGLESRRKELSLLKEMSELDIDILERLSAIIFNPDEIIFERWQDGRLVSFNNKQVLEEIERTKKRLKELYELQASDPSKNYNPQILALEDYLKFLQGAIIEGKDWRELQRDLDSGFIDKRLRDYVQSYINFAKAAEEAGYSIEELYDAMLEMASGTTLDELSNKLADAFRNGEDAVVSFGDTMEEVLKNAIVSAFKNEYIIKEMDKIMKMFDRGFDGEYTPEELDEIRKASEEAAKRLQRQWDRVTEGLGFDFGSGDLGGSMKDGIKRITESQADRLTGILTGMQVDVIESRKSLQISNNLLSSSLDNLIAIEFNTRATADNTYQLVQILQNNQQKALGL